VRHRHGGQSSAPPRLEPLCSHGVAGTLPPARRGRGACQPHSGRGSHRRSTPRGPPLPQWTTGHRVTMADGEEGPSPNVYNITTDIINTVTPRAPSYSSVCAEQ
jgi:hypothetical protein